MLNKTSRILNNDRNNQVLTDYEIALENLRQDMEYLNINSVIKATQYSVESDIPLNIIMNAGEPQYSTEGFLSEIGKSIKNKFEKVGLWFKTTKNHKLALKILSTLKPEVKDILNSNTPDALYKKIIDDRLDDMVNRASKAINVGEDISEQNLPGFIKRILKRVAIATDYLNNDENIPLALTLSAPGYKNIIKGSNSIFASDEDVLAAYKLLTGTDKLPKTSIPEYVKTLKEKLSKKSNGVKILYEVFTDPSSMQTLIDKVQNDAKKAIENKNLDNASKRDKDFHNSEIYQMYDIVYKLIKDYYDGLNHITRLAADISRI